MTQTSARGAKKEGTSDSKQGGSAQAEIESLQQQLDATKQELQAFAYSVSHDLRAPIRAIEGFSKILVEDFGETIDPEGKRFLQHIVTNTQVLSGQIEDLLRYYRVGKFSPVKVAVQLQPLLERIIQEEMAKAKNPGVKFNLQSLSDIYADPELLRLALSELIANAIKFTKTKTDATVSITTQKAENGYDLVSIADNGVGFDPKYAGKLFQVFQKLHPVAEFPGNGIGLAFTRRIVETHGGRIWAEGEPGQGATFHVALPPKP